MFIHVYSFACLLFFLFACLLFIVCLFIVCLFVGGVLFACLLRRLSTVVQKD